MAGFWDPFRRQILQWSIHWWIIHINYSAINVWDFANCSLLFPCTRSNLRLKIPTLHLKTSIIHIILINTWPYTVWLAQMSLPKPTKNQSILRVCRIKNNHRINDVNRLMKWCVKKRTDLNHPIFRCRCCISTQCKHTFCQFICQALSFCAVAGIIILISFFLLLPFILCYFFLSAQFTFLWPHQIYTWRSSC